MKKKNPKPTELRFRLFLISHLSSPLACLRWQQQQTTFCVLGPCFPGVSGAPLGQAHLPFLSLFGRETCAMGMPAGPHFGFPLLLHSLDLSSAPLGPCGQQWFWQAAWRHLPDPFPPLWDTSIPPAEGRAFRARSRQSLALLQAPTLSHAASQGRPLGRWDASQPWPEGETWWLDQERLISVGRDPRPCRKECCPAVAGASLGGTSRDFLGSPLHLRQINWSQSQETHRLPGTLQAVRTAVPAPRTHAKQSL